MLTAGMVMWDLPCDDTSNNKTYCDQNKNKQDRQSIFIETVQYGSYKSV